MSISTHLASLGTQIVSLLTVIASIKPHCQSKQEVVKVLQHLHEAIKQERSLKWI